MRDGSGNISHLTGEISINPAVPIPAWKSPEYGLATMLIALGLAVTGLLILLWQRFGFGSPGLNAGLIGLAALRRRYTTSSSRLVVSP